MKKIVDDVAALRPTLFIAVPRVLERIQSGIAGKIGGQGAVAKLLFGLAYKIKQMRLWMGSSVEGVRASALPVSAHNYVACFVVTCPDSRVSPCQC